MLTTLPENVTIFLKQKPTDTKTEGGGSSFMQGAFEYLEAGQGPTITLLHGLFGGPSNWAEVIPVLARDFHVLAPKFPLDGSIPITSLQPLTDFVKRFLDFKEVEQTALCGNSLGGQVALDFCLKYPARVTKLILAGSAGLYERHLADGSLPRPDKEFVREQAQKVFYDKHYISEDLIEQISQQLRDRHYVRFLIRVAKVTRDYRMDDELAKVRVPTLLVWGAQDEVTPPSVAHQFHKHLPNAQLVFFDRCGHAPPIEHPEKFSQTVREFLAQPLDLTPSPLPEAGRGKFSPLRAGEGPGEGSARTR
jgi:2-hydroxy-6-oxonona-2,4-dienedioate hydrolase